MRKRKKRKYNLRKKQRGEGEKWESEEREGVREGREEKGQRLLAQI